MTDEPTVEPKGSKAGVLAKPLETARAAAADAAEKTAHAIEGNPMSVLVGGLAVGVLAGALIPRSPREGDLLRPLGHRIKQGAALAFKAARDVGIAELAQAGISRAAARAQIGKLIDTVGNAATRAGEAATHAAKAEAKTEAKAKDAADDTNG